MQDGLPSAVIKKFIFLDKVIPMLIIVVVLFNVCWSPLLVFEVLQAFDILPTQLFDELKHIKTFVSLLAYFNR